MEIVVYLIILAIGLAMSASKKNKQTSQRANRPAVQPRPAAPAAQSAKRPLTQEEIKKAVEVLMKERTARQASAHAAVKSAAPAADNSRKIDRMRKVYDSMRDPNGKKEG